MEIDTGEEGVASAPTTVELQDAAIKAKIKSKLSDQSLHPLVDLTALTHYVRMSNELKLLEWTNETRVQTIEAMGERSGLTCCDLGEESTAFLMLETTKGKFYIREGYENLLTAMNNCWQESRTRIVLLGNSGTGKSWFQVFILRRLLKGENNPMGFKFVIRQVGVEIFLIDLEDGNAYLWHPHRLQFSMSHIIDMMGATLYMYEPAFIKDVPPMDLLNIPSLATLSPFVRRIEEYRKSDYYEELYFWPWTFSEINAVALDSNIGLSENDILLRHKYFGGIIRLCLDLEFDFFLKQLESRLANVSMEVLNNKYHDIDRDVTGNSVSGYILCYNAFEKDCYVFDKKVIDYTSAYVKDKVDILVNTRSLKEKVMVILGCLNDQIVDLSGKNLEAVGTELLSRGNDIKWLAKKVGVQGDDWSGFSTTKRGVVRLWDVGERLRLKGQILVSVNTNFPLADIVFSQPNPDHSHDVVQFTWQKSHPFTVRALYDLRVRRLGVEDTVVVNVYVVSPEKEDHYQSIQKNMFLKGRIDVPFNWSKDSVAKTPTEIQTMWDNTHIFVLKPELGWRKLMGTVLRDIP